jgi:hypothetical protein
MRGLLKLQFRKVNLEENHLGFFVGKAKNNRYFSKKTGRAKVLAVFPKIIICARIVTFIQSGTSGFGHLSTSFEHY